VDQVKGGGLLLLQLPSQPLWPLRLPDLSRLRLLWPLRLLDLSRLRRLALPRMRPLAAARLRLRTLPRLRLLALSRLRLVDLSRLRLIDVREARLVSLWLSLWLSLRPLWPRPPALSTASFMRPVIFSTLPMVGANRCLGCVD